MKRLLTAILMAALVLSLFAGCGSKTTSASPSDLTPVTQPDAETAPSTAPDAGTDTAPDASEEPEVTTEPVPVVEPEPEEEKATFRIGGLKGPTTMGMVRFLKDAEEGYSEIDVDFTIAGAADELTPKLIKGELDIVAVPANLASVLYNKTEGAVELLAVNTLGVIYIVETGDTVTSVEALRGQTIYCTGKGSTPEYAIRYILSENGIDPDKDVTLEFKSEPTEIVAALSAGGGVAMLPQPYVTVASANVDGLHIALDLTEEWDKLDNGSMLITGVLVVRREFAEKYPQQIARFLEEYKASTDYINNNVEEAAELVEYYDIVKAPIAKKAIPYCNITYIGGEDMIAPISGYLQVLFDQNPAAVGGTLPGEDFYYVG